MPVGQQGGGQLHRQAGGRSGHGFAKGELVERELVAGGELAVGQHGVGHVQAELAALDAVSGVLDGVGRQGGQLQVAHAALDVQGQRGGQRVELAGDLQRGGAFCPATQLQVGHLRCGGFSVGGLGSFGRETTQAAREVGQVGAVVGADEAVGKVHRAIDQTERADADARGQGWVGSGCTGRWWR